MGLVDQVLVKGLVCQLILDQVLGLVQIDFDISQFYASKGAVLSGVSQIEKGAVLSGVKGQY